MTKALGCIVCGWFQIEGGKLHTVNCPGIVTSININSPGIVERTTVYLTPDEHDILNRLASKLGYLVDKGRYIGRPSISAFLRAVAVGELNIAKPEP